MNGRAQWRRAATKEERRQVAEIDAVIAELERQRRMLSRARYKIVNRCCQRAKYRRSKKEKR